MLGMATPFADNPLLKPCMLDEFHTGSFSCKSINEIDDAPDQNRLF
jgi:hypothetical protein